MTPSEALDVIRQIKYKLEFQVDCVKTDLIQLSFKVKPSPGTRLLTNEDGNATVGTTRMVDITKLNEMELLAVVYDMFAEFEVHECSEFFVYKDLKPFNSHDLLKDANPFNLNIVAPRLKDIDLSFIQNHHRIKNEVTELYKKYANKIYQLQTMNVWQRIKFLIEGRVK